MPAGDKDLLAVVTRSTRALVCKVNEVNELAGPGRGVTVIKTADDDPVVAFLCSSDKEAKLDLETEKGRKLELSPRKYEVASRGGKGREMAKKDRIKTVARAVQFVPLPEKPEEKK